MSMNGSVHSDITRFFLFFFVASLLLLWHSFFESFEQPRVYSTTGIGTMRLCYVVAGVPCSGACVCARCRAVSGCECEDVCEASTIWILPSSHFVRDSLKQVSLAWQVTPAHFIPSFFFSWLHNLRCCKRVPESAFLFHSV